MTGRHVVCVATRPAPGEDPDGLTADEAARWGMFGTVVEQRPDPATGSVLTFVRVGDHGRRSLEAALKARWHSRLAVDARTTSTKETA
jgi:hypothetical protein